MLTGESHVTLRWASAVALAICMLVLSSAAAGGLDDSRSALINKIPVSGGLTGNRAGSLACYIANCPGDPRVSGGWL